MPEISGSEVIDGSDPQKATISWSASPGVLGFILDIRKYVSDGPGKERNESIAGYPKRLSASLTELTVDSLGMVLS